MDNKIHVFFNEENKTILKFPKYNIETIAYIGKNGLTNDKNEGDGKTPIGEFELGLILGIHTEENNKNGLKYMQISKDMY